jgi:hypothetical protein
MPADIAAVVVVEIGVQAAIPLPAAGDRASENAITQAKIVRAIAMPYLPRRISTPWNDGQDN